MLDEAAWRLQAHCHKPGDRGDLRETLGEASHRINLTTGEGASEDSRSDIRRFFTTMFAGIRINLKHLNLPSDWPKEAAIQEMTDFAAGLFIWADWSSNMLDSELAQAVPSSVFKMCSMISEPSPGFNQAK